MEKTPTISILLTFQCTIPENKRDFPVKLNILRDDHLPRTNAVRKWKGFKQKHLLYMSIILKQVTRKGEDAT
jgi:hypothetical protein